MVNDSRISARLDWNRMLGFEQITDARQAIREETATRFSAKVGNKVGQKVGRRSARRSA